MDTTSVERAVLDFKDQAGLRVAIANEDHLNIPSDC
jgi:hypothetical protein